VGVSGEKEEIVEGRRDLTYAGASFCSVLFVLYGWDSLDAVLKNESLPMGMVAYIVGIELLKVIVCLGLYPASNSSFYSQTSSAKELEFLSDVDTSLSNLKLRLPVINVPVSKFQGNSSKHNKHNVGKDFFEQVLEGLKGLLGFLTFVGLCHVLLVLFGAPFFQDWVLTLQFSVILTSWLFVPFCTIIRPSSVLTFIYYMSSWGELNPTFDRHRWRFIFTILGAWIGAGVIPLDWDVPWQKWPIPCLHSATFAHTVINFVYFIYLSYYVYGHDFRKRLSSGRSKTKNY